MKKFSSFVPTEDPQLHKQTELSEVSDEEFDSAWKEKKYKWYHILFQILCFIVFLGPIRMLVSSIFFVLFFGIIILVRKACDFISKDPEFGKPTIMVMAQLTFRVYLFLCGHLYIQVNGKVHPDTRVLFANHTAFIDPFVITILKKVSCVIKAELKENPLLEPVLYNTTPVYVHRNRPGGATKEIKARIEDPKRYPVLIFPEGTLNNGDHMLKFHLGAFLSDKKVQPVAVRYWMPFVPKGWNSLAWTQPNILKYIWCCFSVPFSFITVDILPPMTLEVDGKGSSQEFAKQAQLRLANFLGVKAINRSSHEIFRKPVSKTD